MNYWQSARSKLAQMIAPAPKKALGAYQGSGLRRALAARQARFKLDDEGLAAAVMASEIAYRCMVVRAHAVSRMDWYVTRTGNTERIDSGTPWHHMLHYAFQAFDQNLLYLHAQDRTIWGEFYLEKLVQGSMEKVGPVR